MVRNIMGCLVAIGAGHRPASGCARCSNRARRETAAPTFRAQGLYFVGPYYDAALGLPERTPALDWLP